MLNFDLLSLSRSEYFVPNCTLFRLAPSYHYPLNRQVLTLPKKIIDLPHF